MQLFVLAIGSKPSQTLNAQETPFNAVIDQQLNALNRALAAAEGDARAISFFLYAATLTEPEHWPEQILEKILQFAANKPLQETQESATFPDLACDNRWHLLTAKLNHRIARSPNVLGQLPWRHIKQPSHETLNQTINQTTWSFKEGRWHQGGRHFCVKDLSLEENGGLRCGVPIEYRKKLPQDLRQVAADALRKEGGQLYELSDALNRPTLIRTPSEKTGRATVWRAFLNDREDYFQLLDNPEQCFDLPHSLFKQHDVYGLELTKTLTGKKRAKSALLSGAGALLTKRRKTDHASVGQAQQASESAPEPNPTHEKKKPQTRKARHFVFVSKQTGHIHYVAFSGCQIRRLVTPIVQLPNLNQNQFDKLCPNKIRIQDHWLSKHVGQTCHALGDPNFLAESAHGKGHQMHWPALGLTIALTPQLSAVASVAPRSESLPLDANPSQPEPDKDMYIIAPAQLAGWRVVGAAEPGVAPGFSLGVEIQRGNRSGVIFSAVLPEGKAFDPLLRQPHLFMPLHAAGRDTTLLMYTRCPRTQELLPVRDSDAAFLALIQTAYLNYDRARRLLDMVDVYAESVNPAVTQALTVFDELVERSAGCAALKLKANLILYTQSQESDHALNKARQNLVTCYHHYVAADGLNAYPLSLWEQAQVRTLKINQMSGMISGTLSVKGWSSALRSLLQATKQNDYFKAPLPNYFQQSHLVSFGLRLAAKIASGWQGYNALEFPGRSFDHYRLVCAQALCGTSTTQEKVAATIVLGVLDKAQSHTAPPVIQPHAQANTKLNKHQPWQIVVRFVGQTALKAPLEWLRQVANRRGIPAITFKDSHNLDFHAEPENRFASAALSTTVRPIPTGTQPAFGSPGSGKSDRQFTTLTQLLNTLTDGSDLKPFLLKELELLSTEQKPETDLTALNPTQHKNTLTLSPFGQTNSRIEFSVLLQQYLTQGYQTSTPQAASPQTASPQTASSNDTRFYNAAHGDDASEDAGSFDRDRAHTLLRPLSDWYNNEELLRLYLNGTPGQLKLITESSMSVSGTVPEQNKIQWIEQIRAQARAHVDALIHQRGMTLNHSEHRPLIIADTLRALTYFGDYHLRQEQIDVIDRLSQLRSGEHQLEQLRTGFGKTSVVLPAILNIYARSTPERLAIYMAPDTLMGESLPTLRRTMTECFGVSLDRVVCSRQRLDRNSQCRALLKQLTMAVDLGRPVAISKESFHAIFLSLFGALDQPDEESASEETQRIAHLRQIATLLLDKGMLIVDEAQEVLGKLDVNHAQGAPIPIDDMAINTMSQVFSKWVSDPRLAQLLGGCSREIYLQHLAHARQSMATLIPSQYPHLHSAFQKGIRPDGLAQQSNSTPSVALEHYALLWGIVNEVMPCALHPELGLQFGFDDQSPVVVPFIAADTPSPRSEFGDPLLAMALTLRALYQQGIPRNNLESALNQLREDALRGKSSDARMQQINTFFNMMGVKLKKSFLEIKDQDLKDIIQTLNSPEKRAQLVAHAGEVLFPAVRLFNDSFNANANDLLARVSASVSVTGTPWNYLSLPATVHTRLDKSIEAHVLTQMLDRPMGLVIGDIPVNNYDVFVDAGALKRTLNDEQIAHWWSGDADSTYVFTREGLQCAAKDSALEPVSWVPEDGQIRRVVYPQPFTLGADFSHAPGVKGLITVGRTTPFYQLVQAVGRFRNFERDQVQIDLHLDPSALSALKQWFPEITANSVTVDHVALFALINQSRQQKAEVWTNQLRVIQSAARHQALQKILAADTSVGAYQEFKTHRLAFSDNTHRTALERFGSSQSLSYQALALKQKLNVVVDVPPHPLLTSQEGPQEHVSIQEVQQQSQKFQWKELEKRFNVGRDYAEWPHKFYSINPNKRLTFAPSEKPVTQATAQGRPPIYRLSRLVPKEHPLSGLLPSTLMVSHGFALLGDAIDPDLSLRKNIIDQEQHFSAGYYWLVEDASKNSLAQPNSEARVIMLTNQEAHWALLSLEKRLTFRQFSAQALEEPHVPDRLDASLFGPDADEHSLSAFQEDQLILWQHQCETQGRIVDASTLANLRLALKQRPQEKEAVAQLCHVNLDKPLWYSDHSTQIFSSDRTPQALAKFWFGAINLSAEECHCLETHFAQITEAQKHALLTLEHNRKNPRSTVLSVINKL